MPTSSRACVGDAGGRQLDSRSGESHVGTGAETGGTRPPAQGGRLEPPELEEAGRPLPGACGGGTALGPPGDLRHPVSRVGEDEFMRFTPPANQWSFVGRKIESLNLSGHSLGAGLGPASSRPGQARKGPPSPRGGSWTSQSPPRTLANVPEMLPACALRFQTRGLWAAACPLSQVTESHSTAPTVPWKFRQPPLRGGDRGGGSNHRGVCPCCVVLRGGRRAPVNKATRSHPCGTGVLHDSHLVTGKACYQRSPSGDRIKPVTGVGLLPLRPGAAAGGAAAVRATARKSAWVKVPPNVGEASGSARSSMEPPDGTPVPGVRPSGHPHVVPAPQAVLCGPAAFDTPGTRHLPTSASHGRASPAAPQASCSAQSRAGRTQKQALRMPRVISQVPYRGVLSNQDAGPKPTNQPTEPGIRGSPPSCDVCKSPETLAPLAVILQKCQLPWDRVRGALRCENGVPPHLTVVTFLGATAPWRGPARGCLGGAPVRGRRKPEVFVCRRRSLGAHPSVGPATAQAAGHPAPEGTTPLSPPAAEKAPFGGTCGGQDLAFSFRRPL
ncbi:uncharacterized protein AAES06_006134 isoform 2-T2 [Glossophaga mutica]